MGPVKDLSAGLVAQRRVSAHRTRYKNTGYARRRSEPGVVWTGSSTLPRLHHEHRTLTGAAVRHVPQEKTSCGGPRSAALRRSRVSLTPCLRCLATRVEAGRVCCVSSKKLLGSKVFQSGYRWDRRMAHRFFQ